MRASNMTDATDVMGRSEEETYRLQHAQVYGSAVWSRNRRFQ